MDRPAREMAIVGVILFALATVILLSFTVFSLGKSVANDGAVQSLSVITDFKNIEINQFNDAIVTGRDITSLYRSQESKNIAILVNLKSFENSDAKSSNDRTVFGISDKIYINYNTILNSDLHENIEIKKNTKLSYTENKGIVLKDGVIYLEYFFKLNENGKVLFDGTVSDWSKKGKLEYIDVNSKFVSNLISDNSGEIIGVLFTQI